MTNEKKMSYLVNVDVKMPKAIFDALVLHEAYCVGMGIEYVTEQEVKEQEKIEGEALKKAEAKRAALLGTGISL
jgi:hypothetical protein